MPDPAPEPDFSQYQGEQQQYTPEQHQEQADYNRQQLAGFDDGVGTGTGTGTGTGSTGSEFYGYDNEANPAAGTNNQFYGYDNEGAPQQQNLTGDPRIDGENVGSVLDNYNPQPANGSWDAPNTGFHNTSSFDNPPGFHQYDDGSTFQRFEDGSTLARDTDGNFTSTHATDGTGAGDAAHVNPAGFPVTPADNSIVFRGDRPSMDPARVFENGFQPKGTVDDLMAHVQRNGAGTNFVSSSRDFNIAQDFAMGNGRNNGFIYQMNGTGGIDTAARLNGAAYTGAQSEIAFRGGVPGSQIQGAYPVTRGEVGSFIPNEGYVPPTGNVARAAVGGLGGIVAYEAINAGLPYAQQGVQALENAGYTGTAAAIRETGNIANDFLAGAAPVATGVSSGLQYLGVPQRYADWAGIAADVGVRVSPAGLIYNPLSLATGVGNAAYGVGSRNFSGGGAGGVPSTGTFTDPMGGMIMP